MSEKSTIDDFSDLTDKQMKVEAAAALIVALEYVPEVAEALERIADNLYDIHERLKDIRDKP